MTSLKRTSPRTLRSLSRARRSLPQVKALKTLPSLYIDFNIFRDSLRNNSQQLLKTLQENLPDMNLKEIEIEETRRLTDGEGDDTDDEDVVPLDFRTALLEE